MWIKWSKLQKEFNFYPEAATHIVYKYFAKSTDLCGEFHQQ